jgi:hypothetical protein
MRNDATIAVLLCGLSMACGSLALAQTGADANTGDRGYTIRGEGLVSHGVQSSASTDAFAGIELAGAVEAAASKRGRESAKSAGLSPAVKGNKKAQAFASPEAAVQGFISALRAQDDARLAEIFAAQPELISSGDEIADRTLKQQFLREYDRKHRLEGVAAGMATLIVGESGWPFAVPIVLGNDGYYFNAAAGAQEVVFRRIGRNELGAIGVCRGYVAAQREYASIGHDGQPAGLFAQKLMSDEGKQNGLYWPVGVDSLRSPAGPLLAEAAEEGYKADSAGKSTPYHGYLYRTLTEQGPHARDGAKRYIGGDGRQSGGFALLAYPAEYGRSGVKSFIVNQEGVVYEKDLGKRTREIALEMSKFDPKDWSPAPP